MLELKPERQFRPVRGRVVDETVVAVIDIQNAIDQFAIDASCELTTDTSRSLPREVRTDIEWADVRAPDEIECISEIVSSTQTDVRIEPIIGSRQPAVQRLLQDLLDCPRSLRCVSLDAPNDFCQSLGFSSAEGYACEIRILSAQGRQLLCELQAQEDARNRESIRSRTDSLVIRLKADLVVEYV